MSCSIEHILHGWNEQLISAEKLEKRLFCCKTLSQHTKHFSTVWSNSLHPSHGLSEMWAHLGNQKALLVIYIVRYWDFYFNFNYNEKKSICTLQSVWYSFSEASFQPVKKIIFILLERIRCCPYHYNLLWILAPDDEDFNSD